MTPTDRAAILHAINQLTRIQPSLLEATEPTIMAIQALQDELDTEEDQ